jgi:hypothetical protein
MIIWGGEGDFLITQGIPLITGGSYNPVSDTWQPISRGSAPLVEYGRIVLWTGTEMIAWGAGEFIVPTGRAINKVGGVFTP